jgi:hypothetical protein
MTRRLDPDDLFGGPPVAVLRSWRPDTVTAWKEAANGLLTDQCCAFHRNMEISLRYAWIYRSLPTCFKWAGMAAFASHHIRFALLPLRVDADRTGYGWPRITRYDDRWRWLMMSVVPRFRRLDANATLIESSLARVVTEACEHLARPCLLPHL